MGDCADEGAFERQTYLRKLQADPASRQAARNLQQPAPQAAPGLTLLQGTVPFACMGSDPFSDRLQPRTHDMPRILGVDIPNDTPTHIPLRYLYGIGPTPPLRLCEQPP